ncbi:hypothetical protein [Paraburkholderia phenoliruptrix]|uniref:hypothetical protein n=1 Tax=Paraburkholderia phenoliruptrix TaxID=252970 RepID=UPI003D996E17
MSTEPLRSSKKGDFLGDIAFGKKFCVFYRRRGAQRDFLPTVQSISVSCAHKTGTPHCAAMGAAQWLSVSLSGYEWKSEGMGRQTSAPPG